jgi:hypothetical protein
VTSIPDRDPQAAPHNDAGSVPIQHQQRIDVEAKARVSLAGLGFNIDIKNWFRSFYNGLSRMTLTRDGKADRITATYVGGMSMAHDYLGDAEAYVSAARKLDEHTGQFSPKYFLLCHALELALKAYILAKGGTDKEIRKIRHDLVAAWSSAIALGFRPTNAELDGIVKQVAKAHKDYSFRYGKSWTHFLPSADVFDAAVSRLIEDISPTVMDHPAILRIK